MLKIIARYIVLVTAAMMIGWDVTMLAIGHSDASICGACWDINQISYWLFGLALIAVFVHALIVPYFAKWLFPPKEPR